MTACQANRQLDRLDYHANHVLAVNGASVWIAPRKWIAPALGVGVGAAYKGSLKGRFKGPFKGRIRPSEGSDGRNAEL